MIGSLRVILGRRHVPTFPGCLQHQAPVIGRLLSTSQVSVHGHEMKVLREASSDWEVLQGVESKITKKLQDVRISK